MRVIPFDQTFIDDLMVLGNHLESSARVLHDLLREPDRLAWGMTELQTVDEAAGRDAHALLNRLTTSFVTPFDGEDIHKLTNGLGKTVDLVYGTARRLRTFKVVDRSDHAVGLAELIVECADALLIALQQLRKPSDISPTLLRSVKILEEDGDRRHHAAVASLFDPPRPPLDVIKWKEIYDRLEDTIDECWRSALVIESVAVKYR